MRADSAIPDLHLLIDSGFHHALIIGLAFGVAIVMTLANEMMVVAVDHLVKNDKRMAIAVTDILFGAERYHRIRILRQLVTALKQPCGFWMIGQADLFIVLDPDGGVLLQVANRRGGSGQFNLVEIPFQMSEGFGHLFGILLDDIAICVDRPALHVANFKPLGADRLGDRACHRILIFLLGSGARQQADD